MAEPSAIEQLTLEYVNLFRTDPGGEYARTFPGGTAQANIQNAVNFFGVDVEVLESQLNSLTAVAPLAWNSALNEAATTHSQVMIDYDQQSHRVTHNGEFVEPVLGDRIVNAGYDNRQAWAENVFAFSQDALHGHAGFIIDWGFDDGDFDAEGNLLPNWQTLGDGMQDLLGHRNALISTAYTEIGIGIISETNPATEVGEFVTTQNLANRFDYQAQFVGVVIDDADGDAFYDIGEGLGGVTVQATGGGNTYTTTTWASGGYQLIAAAGTYTITFSGGGLSGPVTKTATIGSSNVKVDAIAGVVLPTIGNDTLAGTEGNDTVDLLAGNDFYEGLGGNDTIFGNAGDDTLIGGAGADAIDGGTGVDTASYVGSNAAVNVDLRLGTATGGHAAGDSHSNIENLIGSIFGDTFFGSNDDSRLEGGLGDDYLQGNLGDDVLIGGLGADDLNGGSGLNDAADYSGSTVGVDVGVDNAAVNLGGEAEGDILLDGGIENLIGSDFDDLLTGNSVRNTLTGGSGADLLGGGDNDDVLLGGDDNDTLIGGRGVDIIDGGAGSDTTSYVNSDLRITVDLVAGTANGSGHGAGDVLTSIENIIGSLFNDALNGDAVANEINGFNGNDTILGFGGADTLLGGNGNDSLNGGAGDDLLIGGVGADTFVFDTLTWGSDRVSGWQDGSDILDFTAAGLGFSDFTLVTVSTSTRLDYALDPTQSVLLLGVDSSAIDATDFV